MTPYDAPMPAAFMHWFLTTVPGQHLQGIPIALHQACASVHPERSTLLCTRSSVVFFLISIVIYYPKLLSIS